MDPRLLLLLFASDSGPQQPQRHGSRSYFAPMCHQASSQETSGIRPKVGVSNGWTASSTYQRSPLDRSCGVSVAT